MINRCDFDDPDLQCRALEDGNEGRALAGYAVRWGKLSNDLGGYRETFVRGAFSDVLGVLGGDVAALLNHDPNKVLGRRSAGTLTVTEDDIGLRYEIASLPRTSYANDLVELMRRGEIRGSSFAFQVAPDGQQRMRIDGQPVRMVSKVSKLRDVGPVSFPAYGDSEATLRWLQEEPAPAPDPDPDPDPPIAPVSDPLADIRRRRLELERF